MRKSSVYALAVRLMDSNHDKGLQRALCYHYTTGQIAAMKINIAPENVSKIVSTIHQSRPGRELSQHSALMGGQFPIENDRDAFKNPIFYAGGRGANRPKNELSLLRVQKTSFYTVF